MVTTTVGTFRMFARPFLSSILALIFCSLLSFATTASDIHTPTKWYFLSGTPGATTKDTLRGFPSILYTASPTTKKLQVVRQIASGADGVQSIRQYGNVIFVAYPVYPTTVSVIHTDHPSQLDTAVFNPGGWVVTDYGLTLAEPQKASIHELLLLVANPERSPKATLISIASVPSAGESRISRNTWYEYSSLRFDGIPGGPILQPDLIGSIEGDDLGVKFRPENRFVTLDRLPADIAAKFRGEMLFYLASTERYLLFLPQYPESEIRSGAWRKEKRQTIYIHDRRANRWFAVSLDGTTSRTRIFGSWLASTVAYGNPNHGPNPGVENERGFETDFLPNVRELYSIFAARSSFIPGYLELFNLKTHQKITLHTGQEDSEILWAGDNQVLYRVNDTIYQARIVGDKIRDPAVVVKDDDVPEIHWVFWSK
ncbi:MAG: hypothetical protein ACYDDI_01415 [Candidatus Acidiferrales bacterium]